MQQWDSAKLFSWILGSPACVLLFQLFKFLLMSMHEAPIGCRTQISQLFQENNVLQRDIVNLE